jgi:hypothetical protein
MREKRRIVVIIGMQDILEELRAKVIRHIPERIALPRQYLAWVADKSAVVLDDTVHRVADILRYPVVDDHADHLSPYAA